MQKLALFLLLTAMLSMIFVLDASVLAQETPSEEPVPETTPEEETTEEMAEDEVMEETTEEEMIEEMEETMVEETVDSPLKQMTAGIDPHEIQCKEGQTLVFKASNWRPACINESSLDVLSARGWVSSHDPSHDDLMQMQEEFMATQPQEETEEEMAEEQVPEEETTEEETELDEEIVDETDTEGKVVPQNYTISLSEDMTMSSQ